MNFREAPKSITGSDPLSTLDHTLMKTHFFSLFSKLIFALLAIFPPLLTAALPEGGQTQAVVNASTAILENRFTKLTVNLATGTYQALDKQKNILYLDKAPWRVNSFRSTAPNSARTAVVEPVGDWIGIGKALLVTSSAPGAPKLLLRVSLYDDKPFAAFNIGLENTTGQPLQVKEMVPLDNGTVFPGLNTAVNYSTLDGFSGGPKTYVDHSPKRRTSLNNMLATFGTPGDNHSFVVGGLSYLEFEKWTEVEGGKAGLVALASARDPIGKRVDPGTRYLIAKDRFYVDGITTNPFETLEAYAENVRIAQEIVLPVCSFPIIDCWFSQVPHFGGGTRDPKDPTRYINNKQIDPVFVGDGGKGEVDYYGRNDSVGAVEEMEVAARSGFLKYSGRIGVLLEPDLYAGPRDPNTQQGWWDDVHWQKGPNNRVKNAPGWKSSNGQFVPPYETAKKWASAVKALGGVPMIYMQTGFRSQDYADQFPGHMIGNGPDMPCLNDKGEMVYRDKEKKELRKLGFDYTDPGFMAHMRQVWENLRVAGVQGIKFDYPDFPFTGWPTTGGLEDPYATTAMHYRNIFQLAKDGLGAESFVHERALSRGSDITLGLSTSQRTEGDTDLIDPPMVSRVGLRWYKNRVILNYDMDGKNPFHVSPLNRDGVRSMLTMSYVSAGTLIVVPSVGRWSPELFYDLGRIYPFHSDRKSARPIDAFTSKYPSVYDYKVDENWHQVTFYNTSLSEEAANINEANLGQKAQLRVGGESIIGVNLSDDTAFGGLGLDPKKQYYIYDFWNNNLVGKFSGSQRFEQKLRPGEARMMAVRTVQSIPQFLSSNRHIMQGLVDFLGSSWQADHTTLSGAFNIVGGETYHAVFAANGYQPKRVAVDNSIHESLKKSQFPNAKPATATIAPVAGNPNLFELRIDRPENGPVAWSIEFEKR